MPILFVHGAGTREYYRRYHIDWGHVQRHLSHYVAPVIAPDPENVTVSLAYWGDVGVALAWDGLSIPRTPWPTLSLFGYSLRPLLRAGRKRHIAAEFWYRFSAILGYHLSRVIAFFRRPQSLQTSVFLGDALHYLATRGEAPRPGPIPARVLAALAEARVNQQARGGEPLVVVSHSLGGVILYDVVTHFLPRMPEYAPIHIDHWTSISSQIGIFEEMKLLLASDARYGPDNPVPFPDRRFLGQWWNVWDPHDFLSFSLQQIINEVDDGQFNSGLSLAGAHMACLKMSSFYALLGQKVAAGLSSPDPAERG
jgi:hypothetical protein